VNAPLNSRITFDDVVGYLNDAIEEADPVSRENLRSALDDYAKRFPRTYRDLRRAPAMRKLLDVIRDCAPEPIS